MTTSEPRAIQPWLVCLRLLVIGLALLVIAAYAVFAALMPHPGFDFERRSDGLIAIYDRVPGSPAASLLHDGDVNTAVDGWPTARNTDWHWFFPPRPQFAYQVRRGAETLIVVVPIVAMPPDVLISRRVPQLVALAAWSVGALILLFATAHNRDAWRLGFVLLGIGVTLSASAGRMYFAPGTYTGFWVLAPVATVAFVELALLPRTGLEGMKAKAP